MAGGRQVNPFGACKNTPGVILHAPAWGSMENNPWGVFTYCAGAGLRYNEQLHTPM